MVVRYVRGIAHTFIGMHEGIGRQPCRYNFFEFVTLKIGPVDIFAKSKQDSRF